MIFFTTISPHSKGADHPVLTCMGLASVPLAFKAWGESLANFLRKHFKVLEIALSHSVDLLTTVEKEVSQAVISVRIPIPFNNHRGGRE